ncbi:hypothetical protein ONZ45_g12241 [Pleurotus djamor]|nr:hypothetical protein ONZ45_g12241 [Pleurotus djamor]
MDTILYAVPKAQSAVFFPCYHQLVLEFHTDKHIINEVAIVTSKSLRNKIAGFTTHRSVSKRAPSVIFPSSSKMKKSVLLVALNFADIPVTIINPVLASQDRPQRERRNVPGAAPLSHVYIPKMDCSQKTSRYKPLPIWRESERVNPFTNIKLPDLLPGIASPNLYPVVNAPRRKCLSIILECQTPNLTIMGFERVCDLPPIGAPDLHAAIDSASNNPIPGRTPRK